MKKLLLIAGMLLVFNSIHSQSDRKLIIDETEYMKSGDSGFRIITTNSTISQNIFTQFNKELVRYGGTKKKDRRGYYWEVSYYFKNEMYDKVVTYLKGGMK